MQPENDKNNAAARSRWYKFLNWNVHCEMVERQFRQAVASAKATGFFEDLYVSQEEHDRQIQLYAGAHPIGSEEVTRNSLVQITKRRLHVERGAALVFSQSSLGSVAAILYPYQSEKLSQNSEYIVWKIFDDPRDITNKEIQKAILAFFRYIRVSSTLFNESWFDRAYIRYIEFRGSKYTNNGGIAKIVFSRWLLPSLSVAGSVASIYAIFR